MPHHYFRFVVVRNPKDRFLSLVRNRILHHHDAARIYAEIGIDGLVGEIGERGTVSQEAFDDLAHRIVRGWKKLNSVDLFHHHALSQMHWIGNRLDSTQLYRIDQMEELRQALQNWSYRRINIYREQTGGPSLAELTPRDDIMEFLKTEYEEDYRVLEY